MVNNITILLNKRQYTTSRYIKRNFAMIRNLLLKVRKMQAADSTCNSLNQLLVTYFGLFSCTSRLDLVVSQTITGCPPSKTISMVHVVVKSRLAWNIRHCRQTVKSDVKIWVTCSPNVMMSSIFKVCSVVFKNTDNMRLAEINSSINNRRTSLVI